MTVIHEKVVIKNRCEVMGGILKIRQRWHVTDSANGSRDDIALLKNHALKSLPFVFLHDLPKGKQLMHTVL